MCDKLIFHSNLSVIPCLSCRNCVLFCQWLLQKKEVSNNKHGAESLPSKTLQKTGLSHRHHTHFLSKCTALITYQKLAQMCVGSDKSTSYVSSLYPTVFVRVSALVCMLHYVWYILCDEWGDTMKEISSWEIMRPVHSRTTQTGTVLLLWVKSVLLGELSLLKEPRG